MSVLLNPHEVRVLACLIEKRLSTPQSYPLTLNSLVIACNQSSNRDPVVNYDEHLVNDALVNTRNQGLSLRLSKSGSRTAKFDEELCRKLQLGDEEAAVLAELMLRGPQTAGEIRQRSTRMRDFPDLEKVEEILEKLSGRAEPLVKKLALQPGRREARFAHLLGGEAALETQTLSIPIQSQSSDSETLTQRVASLEKQMALVLKQLEDLSQAGDS